MRRLKRTLSAWQKTHLSEYDKTHDKEAEGRKAAKEPQPVLRCKRRCRRRYPKRRAGRCSRLRIIIKWTADGSTKGRSRLQRKRHGSGRAQDSQSPQTSAPMQDPMQETTDRAAAKTPGGQYHLSLSLCTLAIALCRACRAAPCALTKPPIITTSFFDFPPF